MGSRWASIASARAAWTSSADGSKHNVLGIDQHLDRSAGAATGLGRELGEGGRCSNLPARPRAPVRTTGDRFGRERRLGHRLAKTEGCAEGVDVGRGAHEFGDRLAHAWRRRVRHQPLEHGGEISDLGLLDVRGVDLRGEHRLRGRRQLDRGGGSTGASATSDAGASCWPCLRAARARCASSGKSGPIDFKISLTALSRSITILRHAPRAHAASGRRKGGPAASRISGRPWPADPG